MPEQPAGDRRAGVRTRCAPDATARVSGSFADSPRWGRVLDASPGGLGLLLPAPFGAGTMLIVEVRRPGLGRPHVAVIRVAHAAPGDGGSYRVGCSAVHGLPEEVVLRLTAGEG